MAEALKELVLASHNQGKIVELREMVAPLHIRVFSADELNLPEPEETGKTFEANAALKAESAAQISGKPSLSDDSGLSVSALNGDPGIYSARWAGPTKDFNVAIEKVRLALLNTGQEPEGAQACFVCVLALAIPGEETVFFRGEVNGVLTFPPRGDRGFGYDPIFIPKHPDCKGNKTFGEKDPAFKHRISHRAEAFQRFLNYLQRHIA